MVQQFPHHVVEPPDFFNPFYLLVNDVSAKMRPIFSVSTRLFMSFSLPAAFQPLSRTFFIAHPFFFSQGQNPAPAFPENAPEGLPYWRNEEFVVK